MKNTTKLKLILQLYTITLDMDDEGNFNLTMISKRNRESQIFIDKAYSIVVSKAFGHMNKMMKAKNHEERF